MKLLLDTNILTWLCHPQKDQNFLVDQWLKELTQSGRFEIIIPEISDYEVRRGLLHIALRSGRATTRTLLRLDQLVDGLEYLPLSTEVMRRAASLWAESRLQGRPTAPPEALDGDVILAAQALDVSGVVVTDNVRHLARFVDCRRWQDVSSRDVDPQSA